MTEFTKQSRVADLPLGIHRRKFLDIVGEQCTVGEALGRMKAFPTQRGKYVGQVRDISVDGRRLAAATLGWTDVSAAYVASIFNEAGFSIQSGLKPEMVDDLQFRHMQTKTHSLFMEALGEDRTVEAVQHRLKRIESSKGDVIGLLLDGKPLKIKIPSWSKHNSQTVAKAFEERGLPLQSGISELKSELPLARLPVAKEASKLRTPILRMLGNSDCTVSEAQQRISIDYEDEARTVIARFRVDGKELKTRMQASAYMDSFAKAFSDFGFPLKETKAAAQEATPFVYDPRDPNNLIVWPERSITGVKFGQIGSQLDKVLQAAGQNRRASGSQAEAHVRELKALQQMKDGPKQR